MRVSLTLLPFVFSSYNKYVIQSLLVAPYQVCRHYSFKDAKC